jgi:hypothetical protein
MGEEDIAEHVVVEVALVAGDISACQSILSVYYQDRMYKVWSIQLQEIIQISYRPGG